jgi:glycosyltransferase involved in cell wall biosynthesis
LDFIGGDAVDAPELHDNSRVKFLNLRDQRPDAPAVAKVLRVLRYYARLIAYATNTKPKLFHILWNNKFELFDRTVLMVYYRLLGKRLVFTAHNVNAGNRDGNDSWLNRITLRIQYRLVDHIFVHTRKMKEQLQATFGVPDRKVTVIPFGINNTVPNTELTPEQARQKLGLSSKEKVLLFFGNIMPYKGLEYLVTAFTHLALSPHCLTNGEDIPLRSLPSRSIMKAGGERAGVRIPRTGFAHSTPELTTADVGSPSPGGEGKGEGERIDLIPERFTERCSENSQLSTANSQLSDSYRLIIAGAPKSKPAACEEYWQRIKAQMETSEARHQILQCIEYVPDEETELYFKAADALVLPYTEIFQSGVLFLGYSFGLPVLAADVGSLKDEIIEGQTGFVFRPRDSVDLAKVIERYFASDLYRNLASHREQIREYANERYSWAKVSDITRRVYGELLAN